MILLKLILAHLLGDFMLQPAKWVTDKNQKKLRSRFLYVHVLVHVALTALFLSDAQLWWIPLIIGVTHFAIDAAKLTFQKKENAGRWFFIDQLLHIAVIVLIVFWQKIIEFEFYWTVKELAIISAVIFLTLPSSIVIKTILRIWTPTTGTENAVADDSLVNAGKYIGMLERLLVFCFISVGHWEGVGFMIAAKSVFRFSDLAQARQRKLTEYVLIGTLLSFGFAILTGLIIQYY